MTLAELEAYSEAIANDAERKQRPICIRCGQEYAVPDSPSFTGPKCYQVLRQMFEEIERMS